MTNKDKSQKTLGSEVNSQMPGQKSKTKTNSMRKFITNVTIVLLYTFAFFFLVFLAYNKVLIAPLYKGGVLIVFLYTVGITILLNILGGFKVGTDRMFNTVLAHLIALVIADVFAYFVFSLVNRAFLTPLPMLVEFLVCVVLAVIWAEISYTFYRKHVKARNLLLVYGDEKANELVEKFLNRKDQYSIQESIKYVKDEKTGEDNLDEILEKISHYEAIVVYRVNSEKRNDIIKFAYKTDIEVYLPPRISDIIVRGAKEINQFDSPLLVCRNCSLSAEQMFVKRAFDIVVSLLGIIVASPFLAIIALAIKLYDHGPVLYTQKRVTLDGRPFDIYKFRSMVVDAEKQGEPKLATEHDKRITPVGRVIRRIRFDELPQLFNILKGDMSFVGPRPERVELQDEIAQTLPEFPFRTKVKAGLTGYAQIMGKYNTSAYDKLLLDLIYIQNFSFFLDIKLILLTIKIMFVKESTEGVKEEPTDSDENQNLNEKSENDEKD